MSNLSLTSNSVIFFALELRADVTKTPKQDPVNFFQKKIAIWISHENLFVSPTSCAESVEVFPPSAVILLICPICSPIVLITTVLTDTSSTVRLIKLTTVASLWGISHHRHQISRRIERGSPYHFFEANQ